MSMSKQDRIEREVEDLVEEFTAIRVACALAKQRRGITALVEALEWYAREELGITGGAIAVERLLADVYKLLEPVEIAPRPDPATPTCPDCFEKRNRVVILKLGSLPDRYCAVCGYRADVEEVAP
jgi:hypothetical protein